MQFARLALPRADSEGMHRFATVLPSVYQLCRVGSYWQGTCGVFERGSFALIVHCRPSRSIVARVQLSSTSNETNDYASHGCDVRGDVRLGVVIPAGRVRP